jgi:hypothetical protein
LEIGFRKTTFKLSCVCLPLEKLVNGKQFPVNEKHFPVKEKFGLVSKKVFSFYFGRKTLSGSYKKLEMSYYLPIISNLVLKLLIAIYIYINLNLPKSRFDIKLRKYECGV